MDAPYENYGLPSMEVSWLKRYLLLFTLSIGAELDELNFVFVSDWSNERSLYAIDKL
jgi:hypothetical protein